jgi:hypothetical protein
VTNPFERLLELLFPAFQYGEAPVQLFNAAAQKIGTLLIL